MRLHRVFRCLTPLGWAAVVVAALVLGVGVSRGLGLAWDPLGLTAARMERAEQSARRGEAEALARELEAVAQQQQALRQHEAQGRLDQIAQATTETLNEARRADDAQTPMDRARLDRLRAHDRQLCIYAGQLAGCAAATGAEPTGSAGL